MNTTYGNQHSPYYTSFLRHGQTTQPSYTEIGTLLPTTPHSPPFGHPHFISLPNPAVFITTLFTQHKHLAPHSKTPSTTTHTHPHTPIRTYPQWYTHGDITAVVIPISSSIAYTPNSSWCHGQWTMNRTSRHPIKILISSNVYEAHQRRRPHAVNLESSVMHC